MEVMVLPVDVDSFDYRFNKTLNEDVRLKSDEYGKWDLDIDNGDYVNCTGLVSLNNACIIAIYLFSLLNIIRKESKISL